MKNGLSILFFILICNCTRAQGIFFPAPNELYGQLYIDVQSSGIFPDSKTFVDCTSRMDPGIILGDYESADKNTLDLKQFVVDHFRIPADPPVFNYVQQEKDLSKHIQNLWSVIRREASGNYDPMGSLLETPYPYIVPGGRYREIHYFDSYFTMLGLKTAREDEMLPNMIDNLTDAINRYGYIPHGFRTYYLSRSQVPFYCMMIELLAEMKGESVYVKYLPAMEREYAYWMEGAKELKPGQAYKRVVRLKDGTYLNRFWDEFDIPRAENYTEDVAVVERAISDFLQQKTFLSEQDKNKSVDSLRSALYRHIRSAASSGADFGNRWFTDEKSMNVMETTDILPVDLNALMLKMESVIAKARKLIGVQNPMVGIYKRSDFNTIFWNERLGYYTDFHHLKNKKMVRITLAGMYPFCFEIEQLKSQQIKAQKASSVLKEKLLKPGGLISFEKKSDSSLVGPFGFASLQWLSIVGLNRCGQSQLANEISNRWMKLNEDIYLRTGKLLEKYDVEEKSVPKYNRFSVQDGFGSTNGVYLALKQKIGMQEEKNK